MKRRIIVKGRFEPWLEIRQARSEPCLMSGGGDVPKSHAAVDGAEHVYALGVPGQILLRDFQQSRGNVQRLLTNLPSSEDHGAAADDHAPTRERAATVRTGVGVAFDDHDALERHVELV